MSKNRNILIAVVSGLLAVFFVNSYISSMESKYLELGTVVNVVTAARDIEEGARLQDGMLQLEKVPKKYLQPDAVTEVAMVRDRITAVPVLHGQQLTGAMLSSSYNLGVSRILPEGKFAHNIVLGAKDSGELLQPGDYVDVYLTVRIDKGLDGANTASELVSKQVLAAVPVLAVNGRSYRLKSQSFSSEGSIGSVVPPRLREGRSSGSSTVTLALDRTEVQKITLSQALGQISVTLRSATSANDQHSVDATQLSARELLGIQEPIITDQWEVFSRAQRSAVRTLSTR